MSMELFNVVLTDVILISALSQKLLGSSSDVKHEENEEQLTQDSPRLDTDNLPIDVSRD